MIKHKFLTLFVALCATTAPWASNTITYTATEKLTRYTLDVGETTFGPAIISHDFSNGTGTIVCDGEITIIGEYAFSEECSAYLTSITIPNSVTTIGEGAFVPCWNLTSVTIGNSVTTIGDRAFEGCTKLISVTVPNVVTTIGYNAFNGVNNVVYSGTATGSPWGAKCVNGYIDGYLIYNDASKTKLCGCSSTAVGEITIPNSVTTIGEGAFGGCDGLISVTIPNSVTTIGEGAFGGCDGLISVTIPNSVTTIGDRAFAGCDGLISVTLNSNAICSRTYTYSANIGSIFGSQVKEYIIGNSVTTIGSSAFYNCSTLTSITIPNSVTMIGYNAFNGVNNIVYSGTATGSPWGAKCVNGYVDGYLVYSDATKTILCGCSSVAVGEIIIPNSVTTIGNEAFYNCSKLNSVTIPNSVTTIGDRAFVTCWNLTSVTIPNSVTTIGDWAFGSCTGLTSVTIGNSVTTIGEGAFGGCTSLISVTIPNSVISLGSQVFYNCSNLTSVTLGNSVTTIGDEAFYNCGKLNSVTIPNSVTAIGYDAFYKCSGLTSITLGNSVTTIGISAFEDCYNLTSVTIPNSVKTIGSSAFRDCTGLTSVTIGNSVDTIGDRAFYKCYGLISVTLGNSVTTIEDEAFYNCSKLNSITIPNSVTMIGHDAFYKCSSLTSVTICNSITAIKGHAFVVCNNIKSVYVVFNSPFETDYSDIIVNEFGSSLLHKIQDIQCVETCCISPTCATVTVDLTNINVSKYSKICLDYKGQKYALQAEVNTILLTGLHPNAETDLGFFSQLPGATDWIDGYKITITTPALELTTLTPKVVSEGNVVVAASTNISDLETNVGFEWRKYNAPPELPSSRAQAILYSGQMEGILHNLSLEYWKVRAYYETADGTCYYGEWATFDPSQPAYFEPTVHTYAMATSPTGNQVQVRGYVMTGTDEVTEQGFEYWFNSGQNVPNRMPTATPDSIYRVTASGQVMTAVLKDLAYSTTYTCRAYAVADGKTYYGEEVQFLTPEDTRPIYTLTLDAGIGGQVNLEAAGQYREGEQVTLRATADKGYVFVQWSDLNIENPRTITMTSDITLSAIFEENQPQDVENVIENTPSNVNKFLRNGQVIIRQGNKTYNVVGQEL